MHTESNSKYNDLEKKSVLEILQNMNQEDKSVPLAVEKVIPQIEKLVLDIVPRMQQGGRIFYIGAGTSGRLGVVDASECPPTFGVPADWVQGIIAGGDGAIRKAVEFAEDNIAQAWKDISLHNPTPLDTVIGIAASGKTPYVIGGIQDAYKNGLLTGSIACNENALISQYSHHPIEVIVGAEFVTGSTRLKAGTAQKLILNMISTSTMIQLGRIKGNKMVDMQLSNYKLVQRGVNMLVEILGISPEQAKNLLSQYGNVRKVLDIYSKHIPPFST